MLSSPLLTDRRQVLTSMIVPPFKLKLAGDGHLRRELEALTVSLGLQHQIELVGSQNWDQIRDLLHGCEVFVLPSRSRTVWHRHYRGRRLPEAGHGQRGRGHS
jgi:glycosyltransferase involved in cell wall biosynthesis